MSFSKLLMEAMLFSKEGEDPSKAIEEQERRGQLTILVNCQLPIKVNGCISDNIRFNGITDGMTYDERKRIVDNNKIEFVKQQYERMGIKIIKQDDNLFYSVELPEGWNTKSTDHHMWNNLFDNKGRRRADFFYKAAFYDRDAFINFNCRYGFTILPFDNYESNASYEERKFKPWKLFLTDNGKRIKELKEIIPTTDEEYYRVDEVLGKIGRAYLEDNYPNWQDINAYWDE